MKQKMEKRRIERRIQEAYTRSCSGVQVPIMETPKIWRAAQAAIALGVDDAGLEKAITDYVAKVRMN